MPLAIREIGDDDIDALASLWQRCGLIRAWNDPHADIAFARSKPNATILGGFESDRLAASAMTGHDGHRGTVYYVCVDPDVQGKGYGRTIMTAAEQWLRDQGAWKLNLVLRTENTAVIGFYSALGYEREERVNMAKWLDPARKPASKT